MKHSLGARLSGGNLEALMRRRSRLLRGAARRRACGPAAARLADILRAHFAAHPPALRRIDASSARGLLHKIVQYEAVHAVRGLRDLRRRLDADRRCYALCADELPEEPLVFIEVALTRGLTGDVTAILDVNGPVLDPGSSDCAMFYSISSGHEGLRGVPLGNLLIRRVVDVLRTECPAIRTFATVSPVPGFRSWLSELAARDGGEIADVLAALDDDAWPTSATWLESKLLPLCASYLLRAKRGAQPLDAVARFHLGNGARLERLNWLGDRSAAGFRRSAGITANYLYALDSIDANRAAYESANSVIAARPVVLLADRLTNQAA